MRFIRDFLSLYQQKHPDWYFFFKYLILIVIVVMSLAALAFRNILTVEANPFFYADF